MRILRVIILFSVFLFSSFSCNENKDTSMTPFEVIGTVLTENNIPIKGIKVTVSHGIAEPVFTSSKGEFHIIGKMEWLMRSINVICMDIDGEENGGEFLTTRQQVQFQKNEEGKFVMRTNIIMLKSKFQIIEDDFTSKSE